MTACVEVLETFEIAGRGRAYVIVMPDSSLKCGDRVRLRHGDEMIIGVVSGIERRNRDPRPGEVTSILLRRSVGGRAKVDEP